MVTFLDDPQNVIAQPRQLELEKKQLITCRQSSEAWDDQGTTHQDIAGVKILVQPLTNLID